MTTPDVIAIARCVRKRRYRSAGTAENVIERMVRQNVAQQPELLGAYYCQSCYGWHIGRRREATQ